ncbi:hypothetical protein [Streptomyces alboflavus]|uniref:hypothetical protein n=1 Tax=Streptomyces alboflavus TaxID=67267 RepID=UPI000527B656|nr:hypothetical protein [Streptomyces alboflavus]
MTSPFRVLRQIVAPTGRHRPRPLLLPDVPIDPPAGPVACGVTDEDTLALLLRSEKVVGTEVAHCAECESETAHAMNRNGTRTCWTCSSTTAGDS